jgi:HPt (histidine-containing phosphotransfer) domain-containing protein
MFLLNGFNGFISKPINIHELNEILKEWLPPEKINQAAETEVPEESEPEAANSDGFIDALERVDGIDTHTGLSHVEGAEDIYQVTVELFYNNLMPECGKMSALMDSGDVSGFATAVHAMKSMLSTIGATKLSEMALELELAAKKEETGYCINNYPALLEKLIELNKGLSAVFQNPDNT